MSCTLKAVCGAILCLWVCAAGGQAQSVDSAAIRAIKASVFSIGCLPAPNKLQFALVGNAGTGFFVNAQGYFVTARHVIQEIQDYSVRCSAVIFTPVGGWEDQSSLADEKYFRFDPGACLKDQPFDVAVCRPVDNPFGDQAVKNNIAPVGFETRQQPDGTDVAFTGFPAGYNQPVTAKASVGTYQTIDGLPEITIAGISWHGTSGAPIYLFNHAVIGLIVAGEKGEVAGLTVAVPSSALVAFLKKNAIRTR